MAESEVIISGLREVAEYMRANKDEPLVELVEDAIKFLEARHSVEYESSMKALLEWARDGIDFCQDADEAVSQAYSIVVKPFMAQLTLEESMEWDRAFADNATFYEPEGENQDCIAHRTWLDVCGKFPRLKAYMGCLP